MAEEFRVAIPLNKGNLIDFRDEIEGEFKRQADNSIVFEMRFNVAGVKIPPDDPRAGGNPAAFCVIKMTGDKATGASTEVSQKVSLGTEFSIEDPSDPKSPRAGTYTLRIPIPNAVIRDPSNLDDPF
jgi:hypothetical protein